MAKKGKKAGKDRHHSSPTAAAGSSNAGVGSDSLLSRVVEVFALPVALALFLAYVYASGVLPRWLASPIAPLGGGSGGGGTAESDAADAAAPEALQALRTAAPVCRANVSHPVVFEQIAHIKIWTIESFLPEDQALALHALLAAEPPPSEGADGRSWVCVMSLSLARSSRWVVPGCCARWY
jgi:hypothetical protein